MANKFVDTNGVKKIKAMVRQDIDAHHDASKQDTLVSGTNIKTINSESLLGSGDIAIASGTKLYKHNLSFTLEMSDSTYLSLRLLTLTTSATPITVSVDGQNIVFDLKASTPDFSSESCRAALFGHDSNYNYFKLDILYATGYGGTSYGIKLTNCGLVGNATLPSLTISSLSVVNPDSVEEL